MHTSPGLACDAGTTFQPWAFSLLAVPATVLSCQLIAPAFSSTAVTKLAQLTLFGTHESIGSWPLCFRSEALRPRNCWAMPTTLPLPPDGEPPDGPSTGPPPWVPPVLPAPGMCRVCPA